LLDGLTIPDNLLQNHVLTLSKYDFDSDVDTNILGHIFEPSKVGMKAILQRLKKHWKNKKEPFH
jgi:hypothetical protein